MPDRDCMRFYRGRSMRGTFKAGDCLFIEQIPIENINPGDIVVCGRISENGEEKELVHRVVVALPEGLVTRGDNNFGIDPSVVTSGNLHGRVTHFERNGKKYPIRGGFWGLMRAQFLHVWLYVRKIIRFVFGIPYRWLRRSGLVSRFWHPDITKIHLKTDKGPLIKYISGKRTVAQWWQDEGRFECRKPYDLVLRINDLIGEHNKGIKWPPSNKSDFSSNDPGEVCKQSLAVDGK